MAVYIGDSSNVPQKVIDLYIGNNENKPRKWLKAWIGDSDNKPRLFWSGNNDMVLLWNYVSDNNNAILYGGNTYQVTLHETIENYNIIVIETRSYYINNPDTFSIFPVDVLSKTYTPNRTNIGTNKGVWQDRVGTFDIVGTSLNKVRDNYGSRYGNSMGLVNVWGINVSLSLTTLWDYNTENNGVIPYDPITLTLRSAVENYDQIIIELASIASDLTNQYGTFLFTISVNALKNAYRPHYFNHTSWNDRSSVFYMSGTTFRKDANNIANTNGIVKIWGIRY